MNIALDSFRLVNSTPSAHKGSFRPDDNMQTGYFLNHKRHYTTGY